MLLKIRYKKTITYEAFVEVHRQINAVGTVVVAAGLADHNNLWKQIAEENSKVELIAEYGRLPTVRQDKEE